MSQDNSEINIRQLVMTMPMGTFQTNTVLSNVLDIWNDRVFFEGESYPAGYFASAIMNVPKEELSPLINAGNQLAVYTGHMIMGETDALRAALPEARLRMHAFLDRLWRYEPFAHMDKKAEENTIDTIFTEEAIPDLVNVNSDLFHFALDYVQALVVIPWGIYTFLCAGWIFELDYLRRLRKRTETYFAVAAHDCFNDEGFKKELEQLTADSFQKFTVSPPVKSTYVFARNPKSKEDMVFVTRICFERIVDFYTYDLFNGLHHGHAPCCCLGCGKYFLTTSKHNVKYCNGISPHDARYTCRQYGAMMHQKEQSKNHPVYRAFSTRTNTIRKHHERGKISDELREQAILVAEELRDKALLDNDYAAGQYIQDISQEAIYAEANRRLKK